MSVISRLKLPNPLSRNEAATASVPKPDLIQRGADAITTEAFEKLRPAKDPMKLKGPQRVAYGPLDAPPTLKRPVVMVPGFMMEASSFDRMAKQLATNPANGPVAVYAADGQFHSGSAQGPVMSADQVKGAKIFEIAYREPFEGPSQKAPQLANAFSAIQRATGQNDVDVVTHSEGGTDFRLYLQQRDPNAGPKINNAVLIGPASHGTDIGNLGAVFGGIVKHANRAAGELAVGSPMIQQLNASWEHQKAQMGGVTTIAISGAPTLAPANNLLHTTVADGDGFMPVKDTAMPGARAVTMQAPNFGPASHLWEVQYSGVINEAMRTLGS